MTTPLEEYIRQIMDHYSAAGLAVAVFDGSGAVKYQNFFGWRDAERKLPVNEDTIFGIASCTKSFTCLAVRQLEERGLLSETDLVSDYIPEWRGTHQPGLRIRHLMSHSGGFFPLKRLLAKDVAAKLGLAADNDHELACSDALAEEGRKQVAAQMEAQTVQSGLIGLPGTYFSYCNDGFALLSEIIRLVSGVPYAQYLRENILQPLGMTRSCCDFTAPARDENAAVLYRVENGVRVGDRDYYNHAHVLNGGGAMKSTLADLKKYVCMYLNEGACAYGGARLLSEDRLRLMLQPVISYLPGVAYANGLMVRNFGSLRVIGHGGALPGVSSQILFSPEANLGVVVLCNTSGVPVSLIADAALRLHAGLPMTEERYTGKPYCWDPAFAADACGVYRSVEEAGEGFELRQRTDGTLFTPAGEAEKDVIPVAQGIAVIPGPFTDAKVRFFTRNGRVFAMLQGSRMLAKVTEQN